MLFYNNNNILVLVIRRVEFIYSYVECVCVCVCGESITKYNEIKISKTENILKIE